MDGRGTQKNEIATKNIATDASGLAESATPLRLEQSSTKWYVLLENPTLTLV